MPSKCSTTRRPCAPGGRLNSVRYHHETRNGLSSGMGSVANNAPMGYVSPGRARRFIPTYGSPYAPAVTSAPTTVEGTVAAYHPRVTNPGREMAGPAAPAAPTRADDCRRQPRASAMRGGVPGRRPLPPRSVPIVARIGPAWVIVPSPFRASCGADRERPGAGAPRPEGEHRDPGRQNAAAERQHGGLGGGEHEQPPEERDPQWYRIQPEPIGAGELGAVPPQQRHRAQLADELHHDARHEEGVDHGAQRKRAARDRQRAQDHEGQVRETPPRMEPREHAKKESFGG